MTKKKGVSGTKEWAASNANVMSGCEHGCLYCYAKANASRFNRIPDGGWTKPVVVEKELERKYGHRKGTIMFPTTHDITPDNLVHAIVVLDKMLDSCNNVLIVSKPHLECIEKLCKRYSNHKGQILFRFTVGSFDDETLRFWEPGAPGYAERFNSLNAAFTSGFRTSVSMEPMLDTDEDDIVRSIETMSAIVTDSIWLGKANKLTERLLHNGHIDVNILSMAEYLEASQTDERIFSLYERLKDHPKVKWKESIKKVVGLEVPTEAGLDI